jgi:hypothetical protein
MDTILPRNDGAYRAWMDAQSDCWFEELEEEEEVTAFETQLRQLALFEAVSLDRSIVEVTR